MKKVLKKVLVLAIGATLVFTACKKDDEKPTAIASGAGTGTATIQGKVTAQLDQTADNDENTKVGLEGIEIKFMYDAADLDVKGNASSETVLVTTRTNANGEYTLTVPTSTSGVNYELVDGSDFVRTVSEDDVDEDGDDIVVQIQYYFTLGTTPDRDLVNGDVWILDITADQGDEVE